MVLGTRSIIIPFLIILLGSPFLLPRTAMCSAESEKPELPAIVENGSEAESREFNTATILGDPQKESVWKRRVVRWVGLLGPSGALALSGLISDTDKRGFRFEDDGWFNKDYRNEGGADKFGHAFVGYTMTRFLTNWVFDYSESTHSRALAYGVISSGLYGLAVELVDASSVKHAFSWRDLVANALGIGFAALLELSPTLDSLFGFSATYWPSDDLEGGHFDVDYNGWRFFLNTKLAGVPKIQDTFLRYCQIDVGFYTRKGGELPYRFDGTPDIHVTLGISINLSQVFQDIFKKNRAISRGARIFEYYHVPLGVTVVDKTVTEGTPKPAVRKRAAK